MNRSQEETTILKMHSYAKKASCSASIESTGSDAAEQAEQAEQFDFPIELA